MKRLVIVGAGALTVSVLFTGLLANGVAAAAPNVAGDVYGDAKKKLSDAGFTAVVVTRVGDAVQDDKCVVDRVQDDPSNVSGTGQKSSSKKALVSLNCYATVASQYGPGYSLQSPQGREVKQAQEQQAAQQQQQQQGGG